MKEEELKKLNDIWLNQNPEQRFGVVTLSGLRDLLKLKKTGATIGEEYQTMVRNYLKNKQNQVIQQDLRLQQIKADFKEACNIASELGIQWK